MSEENRQQEEHWLNEDTARWVGWIGIIAAVIGFFFAPFWLGSLGIILGIINLFSPMKSLGWWAISLGVVAVGIGFFFTGQTPPI